MCSLCTFNAAPNLYFKYCSDTLLGSPFGKLLVSFVLSFSPLICWFDCHSWFRSLTRLIKPIAQPVFEVISMENVVLYARVLLWWWSERWPPISFFIALLSFVFSLSLCLYWRFAFFPVDLKCLEPAFMVTVNKVLCCLIITFFFCSLIVHTICGVHAQSGIDFGANTSYLMLVWIWHGLFLPIYFTIQLIFATIHGSHCTFWYYSWVSLYYFS